MSRSVQPLSRRTLLKGAGAALSLPWLEAMMPTRAAAAQKYPVRLGVLFMPNGTFPQYWTPQKVGRDYDLTPCLEPLGKMKDNTLVLTNLWNQASNTGDGHYVKTAGVLTGTTINKTVGMDINSNGISLDQLMAKHTKGQTPLPSLELGTEPVRTGVDAAVGYTRVYGAHIAWRTPTSPLAKEINPWLVYERLFRAANQTGDKAKQDKPLLDLVLEDANQLSRKLGANDKQRLDEYLHSVRSIEERIERANDPEQNHWEPLSDINPADKPDEGIPANHADHCKLMIDMMILGYQTDITRISTFMFGNSVSNKNFSFLDGVKSGHHSVSHHQKKEENLTQYQRIAEWHVEQYNYMLERMSQIQEGESTLLDNSMVLFISDLNDGDRHSPHNLPVLLGGRGGGKIDTGKHLKYEKDTPLSNLYVSMLDAFGTPVERFADSTGKLPGVLV